MEVVYYQLFIAITILLTNVIRSGLKNSLEG